jgi:site-specific DNA-methyltransferase (adenine-specific)
MSKIELYNCDCLEFMRSMPDKSVDLAFVDPPYNVGKDYGDYKDDLPQSEYFSWCEKWISELKRVCKSVAIYPPKIHLLWFWNQVPENHQIICAWSPEGAIRGKFIHQYIPVLVPPNPLIRTKDHWWNVQVPGLGYYYKEEKFGNPGQTSLDITGRVINAFTRDGDTVLDCFFGTGTTPYYCTVHNRNFIGCEIFEDYFKITEKRIHDAQQQPTLLP